MHRVLARARVTELKEIGPGSTLTRMVAQIPIDHRPKRFRPGITVRGRGLVTGMDEIHTCLLQVARP
jgi:hypothetical protein